MPRDSKPLDPNPNSSDFNPVALGRMFSGNEKPSTPRSNRISSSEENPAMLLGLPGRRSPFDVESGVKAIERKQKARAKVEKAKAAEAAKVKASIQATTKRKREGRQTTLWNTTARVVKGQQPDSKRQRTI